MSHPEFTKHAEFIAYADEGHKDAMGYPFSTWGVARYHDDGSVMRDGDGRQIFQTQSEWKARHGIAAAHPAKPVQMAMF